MQRRTKNGVLVLSALLCSWKMAPSFVFPEDSQAGFPGRREALAGAVALLAVPEVAWAKRGAASGTDTGLPTQQSMPGEIVTEEAISEDWNPVDIGESTLVDPNDPKYKQMSMLARDIEKQKAKNEEFDKMTNEDGKTCQVSGGVSLMEN